MAVGQSVRSCAAALSVAAFAACGYPPLPDLAEKDGGVDASQSPAVDASIDVPHVVLDWQNATLLASGAPDPVIRFVPIDPAPRVRISPLEVAFASSPDDDHDKTSYSPSDGSIAIPGSYLNTTWRLEYTLAGGPPHEVQWAPEDRQGHLTVPVFGRLQREMVPSGSGYAITPPNPPASYHDPRVFSTGVWTEGKATLRGANIDYDFATAVSLSGALGRPEPATGDRAVAIDFGPDPNPDPTKCTLALGSAALDSAALEPLRHTGQTPTWDSGRKPVTSDPAGLSFIARLDDGLGKLYSGGKLSPASQLVFGITPSIDMPGLSATPESATLLGMLLPVPVMETLLQCPREQNPLPDVAQPMLLDQFPRILHVQLVDTRQILGVTLASGMETVLTGTASSKFTMAFPAPLATQITLTTPAQGVVDLAGDTDQVAVGAPRGVFRLDFAPEAGTDLRVDYYDVVLHRITTTGGVSALTTERIYTVTVPEVRIDGTVLASGADYVFEIRSVKGHPRAQHGDFSVVDYPYGAGVVFTRTFKTS